MVASAPVLLLIACAPSGASDAAAPPHTPMAGFDDHVSTSIKGLDAYWSRLLDDSTGTYTPPTIVAYSRGDLPDTVCADGTGPDDWADTAYYCFEDSKLLYELQFLSDIYRTTNPTAATAVLAHEWGHHVQAHRRTPENTLQQELQADCLAGQFLGFRGRGKPDLGGAIDAMPRLAEAGNLRYAQSAWFSEGEHGSPGLRVTAYTLGAVQGGVAEPRADFCDRYTEYVPQPPIRVGEYVLAHLPGFEHDTTAGEVTAQRRDAEVRVVAVDPNELPPVGAAAREQVGAAWAEYAKARGLETIESAPVPEVMNRPNGTFAALVYVAHEAGMVRVGRFSLHRATAGPALIIDSATHHANLNAIDEEAVAEAQALGGALEYYLCVPGQSADPTKEAYATSCDLEHFE